MLTTVSTRRATILIVFLSIFTVVSLVLHPTHLFVTSPSPQVYLRKVHLLLPVDKHAAQTSSNFCKTLLSALVHGYEPTIINWNVESSPSAMHRMKVFGREFSQDL